MNIIVLLISFFPRSLGCCRTHYWLVSVKEYGKECWTWGISVLSVPDVLQQCWSPACWTTGWARGHELLGKWLCKTLHFCSRSTWTQLTALSVFLKRFHFHWGISPPTFWPLLAEKASQQIFVSITAWNLLITNAEENRKEKYTARTWAYQIPQPEYFHPFY